MDVMIDNTDLKRIIGENVRRLRVEKGLTQTELAQRIGVSFVHVNRLEMGKAAPSAEVLFALADVLGVQADSLRQICSVSA